MFEILNILSNVFCVLLILVMLIFIKDMIFLLWVLIDRESYEKWENRKKSKLKSSQ